MSKLVFVRFRHSRKSRDFNLVPSVWHFGKDSSTGPVISRGGYWQYPLEIEADDVIEFSTTRFSDEPELKHFRKGKLLNGVSEAVMVREEKKILKAMKKKK